MKKIAVLVSGRGTNLQAIIDGCKSGYINGNIEVVISNRENAYGLDRARNNDIESVFEKDDNKIIDMLKEKEIDLIIMAGYLKIVSDKFIDEFRNKIINVHPSLIPAFSGDGCYGNRVHQAALDYGVKVSGATVHFVEEEIDHGAIIMQEVVPVLENDTVELLSARVLEVEHKILAKSIKLFCEDKITLDGRRVFIHE